MLGTLFLLVDTTALWRELQRIPLWVVLPAVLLSVVQVVISSWRWRYTGKRLGLSIGLGDAVQEYYLATFINQVLPGGILGGCEPCAAPRRQSRQTTKSGPRGGD
ncbi:MAG: flippase-like domain-containing protein [Marinobacter sp.]|nr:flippase-like domain-containing protein [Marinobacter sp.]